MTVLANTTYLPRVTISSLGDLVQPMQNSGFWAGTRAIVGKAAKQKGSFSKQAGFKYDAGWEKELNAMGKYQEQIDIIEKYFLDKLFF